MSPTKGPTPSCARVLSLEKAQTRAVAALPKIASVACAKAVQPKKIELDALSVRIGVLYTEISGLLAEHCLSDSATFLANEAAFQAGLAPLLVAFSAPCELGK